MLLPSQVIYGISPISALNDLLLLTRAKLIWHSLKNVTRIILGTLKLTSSSIFVKLLGTFFLRKNVSTKQNHSHNRLKSVVFLRHIITRDHENWKFHFSLFTSFLDSISWQLITSTWAADLVSSVVQTKDTSSRSWDC